MGWGEEVVSTGLRSGDDAGEGKRKTRKSFLVLFSSTSTTGSVQD